jgi:hypothetical protein
MADTKTRSTTITPPQQQLDLNNAPEWLERVANALDSAPRMTPHSLYSREAFMGGTNASTEPTGYIQISSELARDLTQHFRTIAGMLRAQGTRTQAVTGQAGKQPQQARAAGGTTKS